MGDSIDDETSWDDAIEDAKIELGYSPDQYLQPYEWDEIVECAKENLATERENKKEEITEEYQEYLKSKDWIITRNAVFFRDSYTCVDCKKPATEVHHLTYEKLKEDGEEETCVSLCRSCHQKRHDSEEC